MHQTYVILAIIRLFFRTPLFHSLKNLFNKSFCLRTILLPRAAAFFLLENLNLDISISRLAILAVSSSFFNFTVESCERYVRKKWAKAGNLGE